MSAKRACCRYSNGALDKGLVPNEPCQPNAYPFGGSLVSLRWHLGGRRSEETAAPRSDRADASQGLRLERSGLREMEWQALKVYNACYTCNAIAKEQDGLCRMLKSQSGRDG